MHTRPSVSRRIHWLTAAVTLVFAVCPPLSSADITATSTKQPPVIDGKLDDAAWGDCPPMLLGTLVASDEKPTVETEVKVAFDQDWIYLGILCKDPHPDKLVMNRPAGRNENGTTYDDSIEIFINPLKRDTYYHFGVSAGNSQRQQLITPENMYPSWTVPWKSETRVGSEGWTAEVAIPFYALGRTGQTMGRTTFNVTRNKKTEPAEYISLVPLKGRGRAAYYAPETFTPLKGIEGVEHEAAFAPVILLAGRLRPYYKKNGRDFYGFMVELTNANGGLPGTAKLVVEDKNLVTGKTWTYPHELELGSGGQGQLFIEVPVDRRVGRSARVAIENETDIRCGWCAVDGMQSLKILTIYPNLSYYSGESTGRLIAGTIFNNDEFTKDGLTLDLNIIDPAGAPFRREAFKTINDHGVTMTFEPPKWKTGVYEVEAKLLDRDGTELATAQTRIDIRPAAPGGTPNITKVDQEMICLTLNGEPFFPLGFMSVAGFGEVDILDEETLEVKRKDVIDRFREGKFNMIFDWDAQPSRTGRSRSRRNIPWSEEYDELVAKDIADKLDGYARAGKAGLYVIPRALSHITVDFNNEKMLRKDLPLLREKVPGVVDQYKKADNLMAWANIDELSRNIQDIGNEYGDMLRRLDPYHVVVSSARGSRLEMFGASDIFAIHAYWGPEGNDRQNRLASKIMGAHATSKCLRRPIFATPQGQRMEYERELTPNERLCGLFLPVIQGAKGMFIFTYPMPNNIVHPVTWRTLCYASKVIDVLSPVLLGNPPPQQILTRVTANPAPPELPELPEARGVFDPSYESVAGPGRENMPTVQVLIHDHPEGGEIILLSNSREAPLSAMMRLSSLGAESRVQGLFSGKVYPLKGGVFEDVLEPFAVRFYRTIKSTRQAGAPVAMAVNAEEGKLEPKNVVYYNPDDKTVIHGGYEKKVNEFIWSPVDDEEGSAIDLAPQGKNLIKNSSFEEYAMPWLPDHWNHGWLARRWFKIFLGQDSSEKYDGKYSIRLNKFTHKIHHMPTICYRYWTGFDKETDYVLSAWLKADKPETQSLWCLVGRRDQYDERKGLSKTFVSGTDWQRIQWAFRIEKDGKLANEHFLAIGIRNIGTAGGEDANLWIDAVQVEKGAEATAYERDAYKAPYLDPKWLTDAVLEEIPDTLE